jgi:hypothetical protein
VAALFGRHGDGGNPLGIRDFQGNELPARRLAVWHWLTAAVLVQALVLAVVGALLLRRPSASAPPAHYVTMSSETSHITGEAPIRALFSASMTVADLRSLLAAQGLLIMRGPSDAGVYTLVAADIHDGRRLAERMEALRADSRVHFIEP